MSQSDPPRIRSVPLDPELATALTRPFNVRRRHEETPEAAERRRRREWHDERRGGREPLGAEGIIGGVRCRIYQPAGAARATLMWLHGGGWLYGEPEGDEAMLQRIADEGDLRVVAVDYRLAPEHPFPAAADDAHNVYRALSETDHIIVAGASAGATLAAGLCLRLRDEGDPLPLSQLLICPALESDGTDDDAGPLRREDMNMFWSAYLQTTGRKPSIYAVPANAGTLRGLPPAYIFTTSGDPLRLEGWRYAERLAADGVEVAAHFLPGGYHGFEYEVPDSAIARRAVGQWIDVLRRVTAAHQRSKGKKELA